MYKISIVIPVYNVLAYIDECLKSLKEQTIGFDNLEVIMVDDCSTDGSREKIKEYVQLYNNIVGIYLDKNSGAAGKARNEGVKAVTSEYIMFLDPDDMYYKDACELLFCTIKETGADMVSGDYSYINEQGEIIKEGYLQGLQIQSKMYSMPYNIEEISKFRYHWGTKIYKMSVIISNKICFPEMISADDSYFIWKYIFSINTAMYMNSLVYKYRQRTQSKSSLTFTLNRKRFEDVEKIMSMISDMFVENNMAEKRYLAYTFVREEYICKMIDSKLDFETIQDILKKWEWLLLLNYDKEGTNEGFTRVVMEVLISSGVVAAATVIVYIREMRAYILELEEGEEWLENQQENIYKEHEAVKAENNKLRSWCDEQEQGRKWAENRYEDIKIEFDKIKNWCEIVEQSKDWADKQYKNIQLEYDEIKTENDRLRGWCDELQRGKNWAEEQYKDLKLEYDKLKNWCDELQQGKDWIETEWNHLKTLID